MHGTVNHKTLHDDELIPRITETDFAVAHKRKWERIGLHTVSYA